MAAKKLQGQVAIITGASRGIGAATAECLARAGAAVVLVARDQDQLATVVDPIRALGQKAMGMAADVSDPEQVEEVVDGALDHFGRVDILVNNAAVIWPLEEVAETDPDEWAYNIHVNLVGPFYLVRNVLPLMTGQRYGRILNVSSRAATIPVIGESAYCAAKAGLDMFTRILARELENSGVTANGLYPGRVDTDMQADLRSVDTSDTVLDFSGSHTAYEQGKLLPPAEVARAIYWLVGPWSRGNNGRIFDLEDRQWFETVCTDVGAPA